MVTSPARDLRIDLLRGLAVLAMMVDHIAGLSPLRWLTGGNQFYTSAAECFVLLAGLSAGLVSARAVQRGTLSATSWRFLHRAGLLYVMVCAITLLFNMGQPLSRLVDIVTLKRPSIFVDVLVLYAMLFVLAPLAAHLLAKGRTWVLLVGSAAVWGGYQVAPQFFNLPFFVGREGHFAFPLAAWQVLFCTAMAIGYHRAELARRLTRVGRTRALVLAGLTTVVLILLNNQGASVGNLFTKESVGFGRLIASASVFSLLYAVTSVLGSRTQGVLGRLLIPFGRHSLLAFVLHLVVLLCIARSGLVLTPLNSATLQALAVAFVWVSIQLSTHVARLPRRQSQRRRLALVWQITASLIRG